MQQAVAEFRLLSEQSDVIAELSSVIYRDVEQFGNISVLSSDTELLHQISEYLWQNASSHFVTYQFAKSTPAVRVNVMLADEIRFAKSAPALCNINYLLGPDDLKFRRITEIVLPAEETVDKARRQYKMYRSAGLQVTHLQR